jgi:DNA-binding MarR family transcriptional regulator
MKVSELDDNLGVPARLAIVATLARAPQLTFMALGAQTGIADGNLHVQTRKLLAAGYLTRERVPRGSRTVTRFELTERGRLALKEYVRRLRDAAEGPFGAARAVEPAAEPGPGATPTAGSRSGSDASQVW